MFKIGAIARSGQLEFDRSNSFWISDYFYCTSNMHSISTGKSPGNEPMPTALRVPTLDGLGAVGDGAHSLREHVVVGEMGVRAALLAGLLGRL